MKIIKRNPILGIINSYGIDSPQPSNISYIWNYGSLLGLCLVIQIITGITLAMHYNSSTDLAFLSVEHIMRDVNNGWIIRYIHANTASLFFIFIYCHMGRGLYYGSYRQPRGMLWSIGVIIFILLIGTGFLGYTLVYGTMSYWGATVITNLLSAIPYIGKDLVELIWGNYSVSSATINRFYSLHYLLPFIIAALTALHLIALHEHGSSNPLGITGNLDRISMHPYFVFKDLVTIMIALIMLGILVFYYPNILAHADNYIPANPMVTPMSIVPEWYLLPFYAILRAIPDKLLGIIAMFGSLLILLTLPWIDNSPIRSNAFRPLNKVLFWFFILNFILLFNWGSVHVEDPYIILGQISTIFYFSFFILIPVVNYIEKGLVEISR